MIDFSQLMTSTISGILVQLPIFILAIWATKTIAREMPRWLRVYHENNTKEIALQKAVLMGK
jgi:hypothetical protein